MNVRDETRHDIHKSASLTLRTFMYRDASHLWRSFSHNSTKINIQFLSKPPVSEPRCVNTRLEVTLLFCHLHLDQDFSAS